MISNHQWYLYQIDPNDLKIINISRDSGGLREVDYPYLKDNYLYLKDDGHPTLLEYTEEDDCLQEVDSKLQELSNSMTRSLVESKNYFRKLGPDLYKEACGNLNSLNSLKYSFDVEKYTSSKLAENISHTDRLVVTSEETINSFDGFRNMIEKAQETFQLLIDDFVVSFNEYLTVCHLQNFSSEYQELESIKLELSRLTASSPEDKQLDKEFLTEIKDQEVFASSLVVIAISLLALFVSGLAMGVGDLGEAFYMILGSIVCFGIAMFLGVNENPWGILFALCVPWGLWQAILLSPFLLFLVPAMFIVPWLIISAKKDVEDKFSSTLIDEERAINKKNKDARFAWEKKLADLTKKADDKRSNLTSKLVSSLMQQPDLSYLSQKDDNRLKVLAETVTDFNELIKSYASLDAEILNINNEYKRLHSENNKLNNKFRSLQDSWGQHRL